MKTLLVLSLFIVATDAWLFWPSGNVPEWKTLTVTFGKFNGLPISEIGAVRERWTLNKSCNANNYFAGNRYVLKEDTAVMLLFDSNGKIAGIQMGVDKSLVSAKAKKLPWILEGNMYVITAYFVEPSTICNGKRKASKYIGDRLLIQNGPKRTQTMRIPYKEEELKGTNWVLGECFPLMGQHYWYGISKNMTCSDFFPVFIMYNGKKLDGFGWNTDGMLTSPRYEHPTPDRLHYFMRSETLPKCLMTAGPLSTQHVYLDNPYTNLCII